MKPGRKSVDLAIRFWPRFLEEDRGYKTPCLIWQGALNSDGYGSVGLGPTIVVGVHVLAYTLLVGPVPKGKELDHLCKVHACAEVTHLEAVTHRENSRRMAKQQVAHLEKHIMPLSFAVTIGGKKLNVAASSKADVARALLEEGYSIAAISKAVPMAYSQVHSIASKEKLSADNRPGRRQDSSSASRPEPQRERSGTNKGREGSTNAPRPAAASASSSRAARLKITHAAPQRKEAPVVQGRSTQPRQQATQALGKLRTPGQLPSDVQVGPCINCGHDLIVRQYLKTGYALAHVNMTADEYYATVQFCCGVPEVLIR